MNSEESEKSNNDQSIDKDKEDKETIVKKPEINKSDLLDKLEKYFEDSELTNLEKYYAKRDTEVESLMYSYYDHVKEVDAVKLLMPIIKPIQAGKFIKNRNDNLFGGSSTMSRRSNSSSSSRSFGSNAMANKTKFGAQKVSINIGGSLDDKDLKNTSILRHKSIDPKISNLKKDLAGGPKVSKSSDVVTPSEFINKNNSLLQNKVKPDLNNRKSVNTKDNKDTNNNNINKGGLIDAAKNNNVNNNNFNKGNIKKPGVSSNLPTNTSESQDKESPNKAKLGIGHSNNNPVKPTSTGGSGAKPVVVNNKTPIKKSELINKVKSSSSSAATTETERPKNFKFEPKKKQSSMVNGKVESKFINKLTY